MSPTPPGFLQPTIKRAKGEGTHTKHQLTHAQMFRVMELTKAQFVDSLLTDVEFALKLSEELGFPVSESSIANARRAFDIPSRKELQALGQQTLPEVRLTALEQKVAAIDRFLAGFFKNDNYAAGPFGGGK